jgi:hypothetical protein
MAMFPDPERISRVVLEKSGHSGPPTDLDAVCRLWPDLSVSEENLDKEGYLISLGVHGAELLIRRQDSPTRKNFTLAHELGHWVLVNLVGENVSFSRAGSSTCSILSHHSRQTPEEMWCNKFAASLLMPKGDVYGCLHGLDGVELLNRILTGPSVFHVSPEAFLNRVADITRVSLLEVVVAEATPKIRRRFLSRHELQDQVEREINQLLDRVCSANDFPQEPILLDRYRATTRLMYASKYSRSWLVSLLPATNDKISWNVG